MDELAAEIKAGKMDFDVVIASPDAMREVGQLGQVLGPRGLMPNPKTGTVTADVVKAINEERKGKVEYRAEKAGVVHAPIGKKSFGKEKLQQNLQALAESIIKAKPATSKGAYLRSITIAPTMGPGIRIEPNQFNVGVV
jgi:large subunit ribosomal protein L1